MDMKVSKHQQQQQPPPKVRFQPYGLDHQANGSGGRSPLGKVRFKAPTSSRLYIHRCTPLTQSRILFSSTQEWTTSMDSKPRKQGF
jgi:hypothetical protein